MIDQVYDDIAVTNWRDYVGGMADDVCNCVRYPCSCGQEQTTIQSPSNDSPTVRPTQDQILKEVFGIISNPIVYGFKQAANKILVEPAKQTNNTMIVVVGILIVGFLIYKVS